MSKVLTATSICQKACCPLYEILVAAIWSILTPFPTILPIPEASEIDFDTSSHVWRLDPLGSLASHNTIQWKLA